MLSRIFITTLFVLLVSGCISDKCGSILCYNEGVCVQGTCACAYAFEGELCSEKWHDKFNKEWRSAEVVKTDTVRNYPLIITPTASPDSFYIFGLAQSVDTILCTRKSFTVFTMHERTLPDSTKMQGGEGVYDFAKDNVTGMYSFSKQDVVTQVRFTWSH